MRWPTISPDLTPLDFFLWPYLGESVYFVFLTNLENLKNRIKKEHLKVNEHVKKFCRLWVALPC
mgnify:CR=1 FL=1